MAATETVGRYFVASSYSSKDGRRWCGLYRITCDDSHIEMRALDELFDNTEAAFKHALKVGVARARKLAQVTEVASPS